MKTTIQINGMVCSHCQKRVKDAILKVEGVESAEVSLEEKSATIIFEQKVADPEKIMEAITEAGYEIRGD